MNTRRNQKSAETGSRDEEHVSAETRAERRRLVQLLGTLTDEQWETPSLCAGWRVREVVAHMTMPYRMSGPRFFFGLIRNRFDFNTFADRTARADTERMTDDRLLTSLADNVENPWTPPGGGVIGALSHDVIHGLDITEALHLPQAPIERIRLVLENSGAKNFEYFGIDISGHRFVCTDTELQLGSGTREHRLNVKDLLLTVTGRIPLPT